MIVLSNGNGLQLKLTWKAGWAVIAFIIAMSAGYYRLVNSVDRIVRRQDAVETLVTEQHGYTRSEIDRFIAASDRQERDTDRRLDRLENSVFRISVTVAAPESKKKVAAKTVPIYGR